jgi:hypothetical protein
MRDVRSNRPVEKERYEAPDDLTIPDFLRRPMPSTDNTAANKGHNQSAAT